MSNEDTIVAIATASQRAGIGIVRLSGANALTIASKVCRKTLKSRYAHYCHFHAPEGDLIDSGIGLYFQAPNSFTGEDVVELQGHGSPIGLDKIVQSCLSLGARLAQPGEFSQRAYLNGKLDLAQAEAIADLINSTTTQAHLAAQNSLTGIFSQQIHAIDEKIISLRVFAEAAIDFADEDIEFLGEGDIKQRFTDIERNFNTLMRRTRQGVLLQEGKTLVIVGAPNAGKSSLLNYWAGEEAAIVTDIPGTTRDMITRQVSLNGVSLNLVDTAGLRLTDERIEQEGINRALEVMARAQKILWIVDAQSKKSDPMIVEHLEPFKEKIIKVFNKVDLTKDAPGVKEESAFISAKTGEGFQEFLDWLACQLNLEVEEGAFIARRRHWDALSRCAAHLEKAKPLVQAYTFDLLAHELKCASEALQEITGKVSSDELLGKIFSSFCIGK